MTTDEPLIDTRNRQQTPTLRDQFAMAAMQGMLSGEDAPNWTLGEPKLNLTWTQKLAEFAYGTADAMIADQGRGQGAGAASMKLSYIHTLQLRGRAERACGEAFRGPIEPALDATPTFVIDGASYTLAEMLAANASDPDLCAWLYEARVGERFPGHIECGRSN